MSKIEETPDDIYIKTDPSINLMHLAYTYYNDASQWWVIARANNLKNIIVTDGSVIRIPINGRLNFIKE
jgi:hypothetical protein